MENFANNLKALQEKIEINSSTPFSSEELEEIPKSRGHPPKEKSRVWVMLLYPDNEYHSEILKTVYTDFVCIGACHDCDKNKDGEKLKEHCHIVFYFPSPVYASHILDKYPDLDPRFLRVRKDIKIQVRYLLHMDSPSKYQYPRSYLEGSVERFYKYIDNEQLESTKVIALLDLIENTEIKSLAEALRIICDNGLYSEYRRNAYTFNLLISNCIAERKNNDNL